MQNCGGAGRGGVGVDIGKARLYFGDVMRVVSGFGARQEIGPFDIGGKDEIDQARRAAGSLLFHPAQSRAGRQGDGPAFGGDFAGDQPEERCLAGAVATDKTGARPRRQEGSCLVEQQPVAEPVGEIIDGEHRSGAIHQFPPGRMCPADNDAFFSPVLLDS